MDLKALNRLIEEGYVSKNDHPGGNLSIYNYTQKCQYEQNWNEITMQCRGLIIDINGEVVSRPFSKFFNLSEHDPEEVPDLPFKIFEKIDGSLGITYWEEGPIPSLATKGSFSSEQAVVGTHILQIDHFPQVNFLDPRLTYLFEIIYPENRIVVDYGGDKDIILLEVIDTATGKSVPRNDWPLGFRKVKEYHYKDYRTLQKKNKENAEGYVVRFDNDFRVKVKFEEYVRLHRIVTGVSSKTVWEYLSTGKSLDELVDRVPDEFYDWVKKTVKDLQDQYNEIYEESKAVFKELETRKATALYFKEQKYPSVLFNMLDGKSPDQVIWRMIKPKYTKPFANECEN